MILKNPAYSREFCHHSVAHIEKQFNGNVITNKTTILCQLLSENECSTYSMNLFINHIMKECGKVLGLQSEGNDLEL